MRRFLLAVPFLFACAKGETPPADSAAMAAAPAALTEADFAGTWSGTATAEGDTTVLAHWSIMCATGTCRLTTAENPADTVTGTYVSTPTAAATLLVPMPDKSMGGAIVTDAGTTRFSGNQIMGTGA
jgi:hypothetical protein